MFLSKEETVTKETTKETKMETKTTLVTTQETITYEFETATTIDVLVDRWTLPNVYTTDIVVKTAAPVYTERPVTTVKTTTITTTPPPPPTKWWIPPPKKKKKKNTKAKRQRRRHLRNPQVPTSGVRRLRLSTPRAVGVLSGNRSDNAEESGGRGSGRGGGVKGVAGLTRTLYVVDKPPPGRGIVRVRGGRGKSREEGAKVSGSGLNHSSCPAWMWTRIEDADEKKTSELSCLRISRNLLICNEQLEQRKRSKRKNSLKLKQKRSSTDFSPHDDDDNDDDDDDAVATYGKSWNQQRNGQTKFDRNLYFTEKEVAGRSSASRSLASKPEPLESTATVATFDSRYYLDVESILEELGLRVDENDVDAVADSWDLMKEEGLEKIGLILFRYWLAEFPRMFDIFSQVAFGDPKEWVRLRPRLPRLSREHIQRFNYWIENLDDPAKLFVSLYEEGWNHAKNNVTLKYFENMKGPILDTVATVMGSRMTMELYRKWQNVLHYLFAQIYEGVTAWEDEAAENKSREAVSDIERVNVARNGRRKIGSDIFDSIGFSMGKPSTTKGAKGVGVGGPSAGIKSGVNGREESGKGKGRGSVEKRRNERLGGGGGGGGGGVGGGGSSRPDNRSKVASGVSIDERKGNGKFVNKPVGGVGGEGFERDNRSGVDGVGRGAGRR